jgi:hypothetical protein
MDTIATVMAVALSELVALWIIYRVWRGPSHVIEKIGISALALIPVVGPVLALFVSNDPGPAHPSLRDNSRYQTDVYDRWRDVIDEKNPTARRRKWRHLRRTPRNGKA